MTDKELIESLKREIELLRQIVALQKDLIARIPSVSVPFVQPADGKMRPYTISYSTTGEPNKWYVINS